MREIDNTLFPSGDDQNPVVAFVLIAGVFLIGEPEQVGENYYLHFPLQFAWNWMQGQGQLVPFPLAGDAAGKFFIYGDSIDAVGSVSTELRKTYYSLKTGLAIPGSMKWEMPPPPGPGSKPPRPRP